MKRLLKFRVPVTIYLLVLMAVAAALRFINIGKASIWHDEGYTMMLAPMDPLEIIVRTARDVHPPLYYIVLHYWMELFGTTEGAARSLSAICLIAVIPLSYLLIRRLYSDSAARLAALFVTLGPFLVRYSQEARMYGMVALLLLAATYALVRGMQDGGRRWWVLYTLLIATSLYTHYYAIFMVVAHVAYVGVTAYPKGRLAPWWGWWLGSSLAAAILFAPWVPSLLAQVSRVQGSFWIPPTNRLTLPHTLMQQLTFTNEDTLSGVVKIMLTLMVAGLITSLFIYAKRHWQPSVLLVSATLMGPLLVILLSITRPIYVDRYFVFASVFFYCLLAVLIIYSWPLRRRPYSQAFAICGLLFLFGLGLYNVDRQANHQMRIIGQIVSEQYREGDEIVSGELYTFFDFSYYNKTSEQLKLYAKNGVNGYGESSLIYDRADQIVVKDLNGLKPTSGHVWVVGKTGEQPYFTDVPKGWQEDGPKYEYGYSAAQRYKLD